MQSSAHDRPAASRLRRRMLAGFASVALLVTACSAADDAELTVIGDDLTGSSEQVEATPDTPDSPIELDAGGADRDGEPPVPDAVIPDAPAPESSPAERQRLQELGITPSEPGSVERLPVPDEDLDDVIVPIPPIESEGVAPSRDDLDQFPSSIPVLPGATLDPVDGNGSGGANDSAAQGAVAAIPPADVGIGQEPTGIETDLDTGRPIVSGVIVPDDAPIPEATEPDGPVPDEAADVCAGEGTCVDGVPVDSLAGPAVGDAGLPSGEVEPPPATPVDCEATPWGRGCDGPPIEGGGVAGEIEDPNADPGEGVEVPQEVVDLLLTPGDNE